MEANTGEEIISFVRPQREREMVVNVATGRFIRAYHGEMLFPYERVRILRYRLRRFVYVRNRLTKRFIRMMRGIMVDGAVVFEYPKGKKGNPLYVDVMVTTLVPPEMINRMGEVEAAIEKGAKQVVSSYFGEIVKDRAKVVGYEYKEEPETAFGIPKTKIVVTEMYPSAHWYLVWNHYHDDNKEEDGLFVLS